MYNSQLKKTDEQGNVLGDVFPITKAQNVQINGTNLQEMFDNNLLMGPQGPVGSPGEKGISGDDGKSAYEVAIENGFKGTEEEWLKSLKGSIGGNLSSVNNGGESWGYGSPLTQNKYAGASVLYENNIYYLGGFDGNNYLDVVEIYDVNNGNWRLGTKLPRTRGSFSAIVFEDKIYCIGGYVNSTYSNSMEIYNITNNTWTTGLNMPIGLSNLTCNLYNGKIYCIGGFDGVSYVNTVHIYDIKANTWSTGENMPTKRASHAAQIVGDKIYCVGGKTATNSFTNKLEIYNIKTNTWSSATPITSARAQFSLQVYNDMLYCIGGYNGSTYLKEVKVYNPKSNIWLDTLNMTVGLSYFTSEIIDNKIYCMGGNTGKASNTLNILTLTKITVTNNSPYKITSGRDMEASNYTGAESEIIYNSDTKYIHVFDGHTKGGIRLAKFDDINPSQINYGNLSMDPVGLYHEIQLNEKFKSITEDQVQDMIEYIPVGYAYMCNTEMSEDNYIILSEKPLSYDGVTRTTSGKFICFSTKSESIVRDVDAIPTNSLVIPPTENMLNLTQLQTSTEHTVVQLSKGNNNCVMNYVGREAELIVNTETSTLHLQDGNTIGGIPLAKQMDVDNLLKRIIELETKLNEILKK